jgi:DNA mismatch repair protein MutS
MPERYITPELKEYEEKITGAEEKILKIELEVYESLLNELMDYLAPVQTNGNIIAVLDCISCFAYNTIQHPL